MIDGRNVFDQAVKNELRTFFASSGVKYSLLKLLIFIPGCL